MTPVSYFGAVNELSGAHAEHEPEAAVVRMSMIVARRPTWPTQTGPLSEKVHDVTDGETRYTLQEATQVFYKGKLSKRTLRREFNRYGIRIERLGNKDFCTAADIDTLRKKARGEPCRADDCPPASCSEKPSPSSRPLGHCRRIERDWHWHRRERH
jgi:hypothetical protein